MATTTERDADLRVPSIALQDRDESARTKEASRTIGGVVSLRKRRACVVRTETCF